MSAIALGVAFIATAAFAQLKTIAIATGGTGGVYYPASAAGWRMCCRRAFPAIQGDR